MEANYCEQLATLATSIPLQSTKQRRFLYSRLQNS